MVSTAGKIKTTMLPQYGTPSIFNARRKADKETTPSPAPAPPSFDNNDSTPAMLRRARSPPVSPTGLSLMRRHPVNLAIGLIVCLLMMTAWFWSSTVPEDHERVAALTAVVRAQESEMQTLHSTLSSLSASAKRQESTTAALVSRLQAAEGKLAAATVPNPMARAADAAGSDAGPTLVHVHFIFDATPLLGPEVELFWLSGNSTEKLYTTIPAGKQADEATFPGQCWRARDPRYAALVLEPDPATSGSDPIMST